MFCLLIVFLSFFSVPAIAAKPPIMISSGVGYSVSLPSGAFGGPVLSHGVRTVIPWGGGWTSIEDLGFTTSVTSFQPCPRWVGDISYGVTEDGLRLGAAYGLKFTPPFDGGDPGITFSLGPVMIKKIDRVGSLAVVVPANYTAGGQWSAGLSLTYAVRLN